MRILMGIVWLLLSLIWPLSFSSPAWAGMTYEESLKQLVEEITAGSVKVKKGRLAILDFTDPTGTPTPLGQFLAEEVGTQILVGGELKVVERALIHSTLKRLHVDQIDPAHVKAVQRAASTIRADLFVSGVYIETADGLHMTARLISPASAQVVGAARSTLPKAGPLAQFFKKEEPLPPVAQIQLPKEPPLPAGLGAHHNDYYELVVQSIELQTSRAKMDLTIENLSRRDLKLLCHLQETLLTDEHGTVWHQSIEDNREGLCTRGVELSPRRKERAVLTFTSSPETAATQFSLHFLEKLPRRDASFVIDGLKVISSPEHAQTTP